MMDKLRIKAAIWAGSIVAHILTIYASFAFMEFSANPRDWGNGMRAASVFVAFLGYVVTAFFVHEGILPAIIKAIDEWSNEP